MGVVRIDDELEKSIERVMALPENKYKYPSKTAFLNIVLHQHLMGTENNNSSNIRQGKGKRVKK